MDKPMTRRKLENRAPLRHGTPKHWTLIFALVFLVELRTGEFVNKVKFKKDHDEVQTSKYYTLKKHSAERLQYFIVIRVHLTFLFFRFMYTRNLYLPSHMKRG